MKEQDEKWLPYPNYEGLYEVSNMCRVGSLKRHVKHPRGKNVFIQERILKPSTSAGYVAYCLSKDGKKKTEKVHWAIGKLFVPNPNKLAELNHKDGNKMNPFPSNLEWVTHSSNMKHAIDMGLMKAPTKKFSKLTKGQIANIPIWRAQGNTLQIIADKLGITKQAVKYRLDSPQK